MTFLSMHVSDMTEQRRPTLPKSGHIYQTSFTPNNDHFIDQLPTETAASDPYMGIDTPSDEFYTINTNQSGPPMSATHKLQPRLLRSNLNSKPNTFPKKPARQKWTGSIYLPEHIYKLLSQEAKDACQKYNMEAIQKFKSSRNLHETSLIHDVHEDTQDKSPSSNEDDEFQECQEFNADQDLEPPANDLLDFTSSQEHSDDQLDQVLQTYQAYLESQSVSQTPTRQLNTHITYHVAQANRKISMKFPLVSCCSCVNNPSSS